MAMDSRIRNLHDHSCNSLYHGYWYDGNAEGIKPESNPISTEQLARKTISFRGQYFLFLPIHLFFSANLEIFIIIALFAFL